MEFRFIAGSPALDFVNTVDWEGDTPAESERLTNYGTLLEWAVASGTMDRKLGNQLAALAKADPALASRAHAAALRARAAVRTVMRETAENGKPSKTATEAFNRLLRSALAHAALNPGRDTGRWAWEGAEENLTSPVWPVLWSAAELLASSEVPRIRECSAERCGWMYVDRSRPRNRRWCEMETCGNRAKARRHYHRSRSS